METKCCGNCKETKLLSDFSKCSSSPDGLQRNCSSCNRIAAKKWRTNSPKYRINWKNENPEYFKNYYSQNKEKYAGYRQKQSLKTQNSKI